MAQIYKIVTGSACVMVIELRVSLGKRIVNVAGLVPFGFVLYRRFRGRRFYNFITPNKYIMPVKLVALCIVILFVLLSLCKSNYASVSRITAETDSGIVFTVWTDKTEIASGEEMTIHYKIRNDGNRTVYFVSEPEVSIYVEGHVIQIAEPVPILGHRNIFDYLYTELRPKRSLDKRIVIPASKYKYSQLWDLTMGFLYVFDKKGLDKNDKQFTDETLLIGELRQRGSIVDIGTLGISVR